MGFLLWSPSCGRALVAGVAVVCLASCVQVPRRDGVAAIDVNEVVKRIKCDLNKIVIDKAYETFLHEERPEKRQPFLFLRSWAAKVRLTIAVDESSQINPGASYVTPLRTVSNVAQTFTLGVGGGATTQAVRQEDIEFLLSFKDIEAENDSGKMNTELYDFCRPLPGLLLESNLGLKSFVDAALKPVETGILKPGNNIGPGAGTPPAIPKADLSKLVAERRVVDPNAIPAASIRELASQSFKVDQFSKKLIQKFNISPEVAEMTAKDLESKNPTNKNNAEKVKKLLANSTEATALETKTQAIVNNIVKPRYSIAQGSFDGSCIKPVSELQFEAVAQSTNVSAFVIDTDKAAETAADNTNIDKALQDSEKALAKAYLARDKVIDATNRMADEMRVCAKKTIAVRKEKEKEGPSVYDPISTISETVNFYVTLTGSVTPTWKLVRITAPLSGTFLSGTRKDTNTLILSLGRPVSGPNGTQASLAMENQILYSILGQALPAGRP